jgi:hypothetical protein
MFGFSKYAEMIDKRTQFRKEAIERVRMRELDPEAYTKYAEDLRETLRTEFRAKADLNGNIQDTSRGAMELKEIIAPGTDAAMYLSKGYDNPKTKSGVALSYADFGSIVPVPVSSGADPFEYAMESFVEERLAEIEKEDYEEFNAMRVFVMSAELAEESGSYLKNLTSQLTEQFRAFAAVNELVDAEEPSPERGEKRKIQIADIARKTISFLKDTVLGAIQKNAIREATVESRIY